MIVNPQSVGRQTSVRKIASRQIAHRCQRRVLARVIMMEGGYAEVANHRSVKTFSIETLQSRSGTTCRSRTGKTRQFIFRRYSTRVIPLPSPVVEISYSSMECCLRCRESS